MNRLRRKRSQERDNEQPQDSEEDESGQMADVICSTRTHLSSSSSSTYLIAFVTVLVMAGLANYVDAQALNDPITQYIEGRLGNRRIFWCPSGYGYLAYCPQPTDWDNYNWCCTWPYMGSWKPSCCPFALPTGAVVAIIIASIILVAVLIGLSCWCCYCCPLYKQLYEYEDEEITPPPGREGGGNR